MIYEFIIVADIVLIWKYKKAGNIMEASLISNMI